MAESSDYESDAGASPSVSSDESTNSASSRSSSPATKVSNEKGQITTTKRNGGASTSANTATPDKSAAIQRTSPSSGHIVLRKRLFSNNEANNNTGSSRGSTASTSKTSGSPSVTFADNPKTSNSSTTTSRKRKLSSPESSNQNTKVQVSSLSKSCSPTKPTRSKRRRTRSERNLLAGKTGTSPTNKTQVMAEGEEAVVALDAEIDRVLEEKAIKNNLSAFNVKSIIRHVITNNMVQKMIMSAVRKKAEAADAGSSDDDGLLEPKMTRAKTKELMENKQISLWPIVDSPVKKKRPISETHMLIHNDLPEDSSGDEEYVPKEHDINETLHSDDENSSIASATSDVGSPAVVKQRVMTRRSLQAEAEKSFANDPLFKTPPPRPQTTKKSPEKSAISLRTRSKLPLTDTPLEDLERQLVPPDVTNDMYYWGHETDNEDYLAFLKDFLNPGLFKENEGNEMDDDADPEYNVMEDDEDLHDREELRRDRAVKVPKKELTQLIAELFEPGFLSCDDLDDHDLESCLTNFTPLVNDSGFLEDGRTATNTTFSTSGNDFQSAAILENIIQGIDSNKISLPTNGDTETPSVNINQEPEAAPTANYFPNEVNENLVSVPESVTLEIGGSKVKVDVGGKVNNDNLQPSTTSTLTTSLKSLTEKEPLFRQCDLELLQQQMRQHIQLLAQSYVLTASSEDPGLKHIAQQTKIMVNNLNSTARLASQSSRSTFSVCNLGSAWTLVNYWPHKFLQQSPIKKKILEEKYISESGMTCVDSKGNTSIFPRHVVKVIVENPTFIYDDLLPECFDQRNRQNRCAFCFSEDALLVGSLDMFQSLNAAEAEKTKHVSQAEMAEVISDILLVAHPPKQVFHRIRNLRKVNSKNRYPSCQEIKKYFTDGILPPVDRTVLELTEMDKEPLIRRKGKTLSKLWMTLLRRYEESSSYHMWDSTLIKDPVAKSASEKWTKNRRVRASRKSKDEAKTSEDPPPPPRVKGTDVVERVFPRGALEVEQNNPGMEAIPLYGPNCKIAAIAYIPKYALPKPVDSCETTTVQIVEVEEEDVAPTPQPQAIEYPIEEAVQCETLKFYSDTKGFVWTGVEASSNRNGNGKGDSSPKKGNGNNGNPPQNQQASQPQSKGSSTVGNNSTQTTTSATGHQAPDGNGDDSDEDPERRSNRRKRNLPKDYDGDGERFKEDNSEGKNDNCDQSSKPKKANTQTSLPGIPAPTTTAMAGSSPNNSFPQTTKPIASSPPIPQQQVSSSSPAGLKPQKKGKKSPGTSQNCNRRVSKYNVTSAEQMVEDDPNEFEEIGDAYMEAYLLKVQAATEANHPSIYNSFIQLLMEAGEKPIDQPELYGRVKALFKEYPDLLREFESFLDPTMVVEDNPGPNTGSSANDGVVAEITFLQKLEKFTEKTPQLKAKIINKIRSIKEANPNVTEIELARALEPFVIVNPVMMAAFKDLLPSVYRPQSMSSGIDFEVLELDMEEPVKESQEDLKFEVVKLPEETAVPATNTCPCMCHSKTSDPAFSNRSKHCGKCSLKFQEGKIYHHNGRVMRPVSVELVPASPKHSPNSSSSNNRNSSQSKEQDSKLRKETFHPQHQVKQKDVKVPETKSKAPAQAQHPPPIQPPPQSSPLPSKQAGISGTASCSSNPKPNTSTSTVNATKPVSETGSKTEGSDQAEECPSMKMDNSSKPQDLQQILDKDIQVSGDDDDDWTEEEDTIILMTCQQEPHLSLAWRKMAAKIPHRSVEQLKSRCSELIELIQNSDESSEQV